MHNTALLAALQTERQAHVLINATTRVRPALSPAQVGGGRIAESAMFCVKGGTDTRVDYGRATSCFPGDATLARVDATTGAALGPVRMDEVAIGDAVRCLVPAAGAGGVEGDARDAAQTYVPGVCHVFNYLDAHKVGAARARGWRQSRGWTSAVQPSMHGMSACIRTLAPPQSSCRHTKPS